MCFSNGRAIVPLLDQTNGPTGMLVMRCCSDMAEILGILTPTQDANSMRKVARGLPEESNGTIHIVENTRIGPFRRTGTAIDGGVA